ncbi:unnamed protein product [Amoebophrya sp. A120]|nr:unnamed protein product [Amoebophrya sp. A120]|eukprot:GSA120T00000799001.1
MLEEGTTSSKRKANTSTICFHGELAVVLQKKLKGFLKRIRGCKGEQTAPVGDETHDEAGRSLVLLLKFMGQLFLVQALPLKVIHTALENVLELKEGGESESRGAGTSTTTTTPKSGASEISTTKERVLPEAQVVGACELFITIGYTLQNRITTRPTYQQAFTSGLTEAVAASARKDLLPNSFAKLQALHESRSPADPNEYQYSERCRVKIQIVLDWLLEGNGKWF